MRKSIVGKCGFAALLLSCCLMLCMCAQPPAGTQPENTEATKVTRPPVVEDLVIYWNVDRALYCAQSESILSLRKMNAEKKYEIRMALDGKQLILKTKKSEIVNRVDFQYAVGLVLDEQGDISDVKTISQCGLEIAANWSYVFGVQADTATCNTAASGKGTEFKLDTKDAKIYDVSTADDACGKTTQLRKGDQIYALKNREGKVTHVFVTQRTDLSGDIAHTAHCVCGGAGAYGHTCQEQAEWIAWGDDLNEQNTLPVESGHYYLVKDVMLSKRHEFPAGKDITICLNGKKIDGKNRLFGVYAKLNMCDCQFTQSGDSIRYKGTVTMSYSADNASGGGFYVYDGCEVNVFGGNYVATGYISNGGLAQTRLGGKMNIYGGCFSGGEVKNKGGNINMMDGGTVYLYGGEITGGEAGVGGGMCLVVGELHIAGNVKIRDNVDSNLYISDGLMLKIHGNLPEDTCIGITMENPGLPFAEGAEEADAQRFVSDVPGYKVVWDSQTKQLSLKAE